MGIKRCPSFSKRPGFPCGLRVLLLDADQAQRQDCEQRLKECSYEVTLCSSTAETLSKLSGSCSYDVLLADKPSIGSSADLEQLLQAAEGLPCVFMASSPSAEDVMAGVKLGAVDFLSKPLAPLKLRNIWQHTVRKMMCNMNINCSDSAAVDDLAAAAAACPGKPRISMEVIMEEAEEDLAAAAAAGAAVPGAAAAAAAAAGKPPAPACSSGTTLGSSGGSVINYSNGPNMALAITSSFYEPAKAPAGGSSACLSRCGSSTMTSMRYDASFGSPSSGPDSPVMDRPAKQQHGTHGPVRACPSTRSLNSAASCHSSWASFGLPSSPSSDTLQKQASDAAGLEADSTADELAGARAAPRCLKKAIRHPPAATAACAAAAACKPPLAGKPAAQAASPAQQARAAPAPSAAAKQGAPAALASIPLPTGLGPLPQGMVWGMPMCPLVRAPGIVPPANPSTGAPAAAGQAAGMPAMGMAAPWGMCGMPAMFGGMPPAPFMAPGPSYGSMMPAMGVAYPAAAAGYGMQPVGGFMEPFGQQQMWGQPAEQQQQPVQGCGAATAVEPTGAAVAAALDASFSAAALLGGPGAGGASAEAAAAVAMDDDAFDFMLGDIAAEDDITDVCGGLLDAIKMPADLSSEMQALEADLQQQAAAAAAAAAAAGRCSFESTAAAQRSRVSFDCSTASTCTAARASFEASQRCNSARVSFEVSCQQARSSRVSFEVSCHNSTKAAAAGAAGSGSCSPANLKNAASAPAELLGSVTDLFAACSGDSSHGSGLQRVDSCGMLADLQSFFASSGDSSCPQDCADSALTDSSGMFLDPLDDMPIDVGMRKNDSFAELINASLPGLAN